MKCAKTGLANACRILQDRIENRFQLARRRTDDTQYLRCCCLAVQRFAQFVKQPCVLNSDYGLSGEVLKQLNLLIGEWTHLLPINAEGANELAFLQHRNGPTRPCAP